MAQNRYYIRFAMFIIVFFFLNLIDNFDMENITVQVIERKANQLDQHVSDVYKALL